MREQRGYMRDLLQSTLRVLLWFIKQYWGIVTVPGIPRVHRPLCFCFFLSPVVSILVQLLGPHSCIHKNKYEWGMTQSSCVCEKPQKRGLIDDLFQDSLFFTNRWSESTSFNSYTRSRHVGLNPLMLYENTSAVCSTGCLSEAVKNAWNVVTLDLIQPGFSSAHSHLFFKVTGFYRPVKPSFKMN